MAEGAAGNQVASGGGHEQVRGMLKIATELAQKALASPWQKNTIAPRNLLLGASVGLGLWLMGSTITVEPLAKLYDALGATLFHVLATGVVIYALLAYELAARSDLWVHQLEVEVPLQQVHKELHDMQAELMAKAGELASVADGRQALLTDMCTRFEARAKIYEKALARLSARLKSDPSDLDSDELWLKMTAALRQERDTYWDQVSRAWSGVNSELCLLDASECSSQ